MKQGSGKQNETKLTKMSADCKVLRGKRLIRCGGPVLNDELFG